MCPGASSTPEMDNVKRINSRICLFIYSSILIHSIPIPLQ